MSESVIRITNGPMRQNCYIVHEDGIALIIDPGSEADRIIEAIDSNHLQPRAILNTHAHFDHIGAVEAVRTHFQIPFFLHDGDVPLMRRANLYKLIFSSETNVTVPKQVTSVADIRQSDLGPFDVSVLETPGHTEGGVSFVIGASLFSGDTLMGSGPGRSDLPGGSRKALQQSLQKYAALPPDLTIYAGHGRPVSLGEALLAGAGAEA
ncbi:MAG: MBL fold metallo-hydrolase [Rhodospirillales bacterium]